MVGGGVPDGSRKTLRTTGKKFTAFGIGVGEGVLVGSKKILRITGKKFTILGTDVGEGEADPWPTSSHPALFWATAPISNAVAIANRMTPATTI